MHPVKLLQPGPENLLGMPSRTRSMMNRTPQAAQRARNITKKQKTIGASVIGGTAIGLMHRGRGSNSQRGGYNPPRLREPRGSGRYA